MKMKTVAIWGVVFAIGAAITVPKFLKQEETIEIAVTPVVEAECPQTDTIVVQSSLMGLIEPSDLYYVVPKIPGEVTEVLVKNGDIVKVGDVLAKIDTKQVDAARINLDTARVSMQDAQTNLQRMQVLYESGDISAQSFEQIKSSAEMAKLQYEAAQLAYNTQVEYSQITAPIAGKIESCDMEVKDMVAQSSPVCVITGEGNRSVRFSVPERVVKGLAVGQQIVLEKNGSSYSGEITEIASMVDPQTGLFQVKGNIVDGEALMNGSYAKVTMDAQRAEGVMTIPLDAVYYKDTEPYVYLYQDGVVTERAIATGLSNNEKIQVTEGLTNEDQVIVSWTTDLYEGANVNLREEQ